MDADDENTSITQPSLIPVNTNPQSLTRLPKLTIPTFSGNPLTWQTFWDSFSAAVYSNNTLSGIHKFNYLRDHSIAGTIWANREDGECPHARSAGLTKPIKQFG